MIAFSVDGVPKPQPRPRAFARHGRARVYDPATAEGWKSSVAMAAAGHRPLTPLAGLIEVDLIFRLPRPKAHYHTGRRAGVLRDGAPLWHSGKPDLDNLAKAVIDALTEIGFWGDDGQIARLTVEKRYSARPGCDVRIDEGVPVDRPRGAA